MYLIYDSETTGLPKNYNAPIDDFNNWPRIVQLSWQLHHVDGRLANRGNFLIKPDDWIVPFETAKLHGITTEKAQEFGKPLEEVLNNFSKDVAQASFIVGHNIAFDQNVTGCEYLRTFGKNSLHEIPVLDTMKSTVDFCQIPGKRRGRFKYPTLGELHQKLFNKGFEAAHDAAYDVHATAKCFFALLKLGHIFPKPIGPDGVELKLLNVTYQEPKLEKSNFKTQVEVKKKLSATSDRELSNIPVDISKFVHLHNHTEHSVLQSTTKLKKLFAKTKDMNMKAVAITDLGNMFGVYKFVKGALAEDLLPIVGCEFFVTEEQAKKQKGDRYFQQLLIAKNKKGYHNLAKMSTSGFVDGFYYVPRIDKKIIEAHKENLICLTGNIYGEIPQLILNQGEPAAEEAFKYWHQLFGEDFYVQISRHGLEEQKIINEVLIRLADKYKVKLIATNENFYLDKTEHSTHDVLLCIKESENINTPGKRNGLKKENYYFKSPREMAALFKDLPDAINNLDELVSKIEPYKLVQDVLLPAFDIPKEFNNQDDYLRHLTYEGASKRYESITDEIKERLEFELGTIKKTGYPGYFLIVWDFIKVARSMGVSVGPGRGSAAGSAVAYCIGITNVDPIKYSLLFERFLNPDRVSLPDIDIDFDDEGRSKVLDYVVEKYGKTQVAQIITYGTMAAKSSIKDAARAMELHLSDANRIANYVPSKPGTSLNDAFKESKELNDIKNASSLEGEVLRKAIELEGNMRNTGVHACGVIITPTDITELIPATRSKDTDLLLTQYDNSVVEEAGLLKMDFLGLKTLSIINSALENIKERHNIEIDIDNIPLDDETTYRLYQDGNTNGTFQFESPGMQGHLRNLKPDKFEDLIAMNALYRPGPMEYIPDFIERKHGRKPIKYDLPDMEEFLADTYGITVYQEQVMLLSQKLAGFTKGQADGLRKAMGKKIKAMLDKLKPLFINGCKERKHDEKIAEKIWKDWEAFAAYAFNKSHSTCYSFVAYQTGYLKANYPAEYMAAVLTRNLSNIEKVSFFLEECKRLDIKVLGPDINESSLIFKVNSKGEIRFGMGAIKGAGEKVIQAIIDERRANGEFTSIYDFAERNYKYGVNKKIYECLAKAGAFDCFTEFHRRQFFFSELGQPSFIENLVKFSAKKEAEKNSAQQSLFGGTGLADLPTPKPPICEAFGELELLNTEKEIIGLYLSGHPLDKYSFEFDRIINTKLIDLKDIGNEHINQKLIFGGIVTNVQHLMSKTGNPYGRFTLEDFSGDHEFLLFSTDYVKFRNFLNKDWCLFIQAFVNRSYNEGQPPRIGFNSIQQLDTVRKNHLKGITLTVSLDAINNHNMLNELETIFKKYTGQTQLKMIIVDKEHNISFDGIVNKYKVEANNDFFSNIQAQKGLSYQIDLSLH